MSLSESQFPQLYNGKKFKRDKDMGQVLSRGWGAAIF